MALVMQEYCTSEGQQLDMETVALLAKEHERKKKEDEQYKDLTIADFVDILKNIEQQSGYETARHFAEHLNYEVLCELAKMYVTGKDTNPDNDPNRMPTKYMLLYGAEDGKLHEINDHPDKSENEDHKITVFNLRKSLILQGAVIEKTGPYDFSVFEAYRNYFVQFVKGIRKGLNHTISKGEDLGKIARMYMLSSWKYLYEFNKEIIGNNPDLLTEGTELNIPQWDSTQGDEMIAEKGGKVEKYIGGLIWRYPWQSKSISFMDEIKDGLMADFDDEREFRIIAANTGETVASGTIKKSDEVDVLIPDLVETREEVDGLVIRKR